MFAGERVGPREIAQQFRGLGEQKTWDLCDRAFGKDLPGAIRSLRAIEEGGDDPLMVLGGIAARLRDLLKVRSLPDRMPPAQVAKEAGLRFDWQARRYQQQARNFSMTQLVTLHDHITEADRALKSGATGDVVMPTARDRDRRLAIRASTSHEPSTLEQHAPASELARELRPAEVALEDTVHRPVVQDAFLDLFRLDVIAERRIEDHEARARSAGSPPGTGLAARDRDARRSGR